MEPDCSLPRLTGLLRLFLSDEKPANTEELYLSRQLLLQKRSTSSTTSSSSAAGGTPAGDANKGLQWADMESCIRAAGGAEAGDTRAARATFREFVELVLPIVGDEGEGGVAVATRVL